ncbi:MAG: hypothetical protein IPO17_14370 [Flavobacteriales bacterium]|nr:hypothetical protein [Flavobacteriales bacterium]
MRRSSPFTHARAAVHCMAGLLLAGAWLCTGTAYAQLDTVDVHLDAITVEDGLPMGYVLAMAQDSTGYLWLGTNDGLARYDGYDFTVFRQDAQDSSSIGANRISSLLVDREGYLWVGFAPFGLDRYDPRTGRFAHVRVDGLGADVRSTLLADLCLDARGRVWMTATIPNDVVAYVVDPALPGPLVVMEPRELRPPIAPLRNAFAFIGPGGDPWFTSPDTIRCAHYGSDGSVQLTDRPHSIPWWMGDGIRQSPILMTDPVSSTMLVTEPGYLTRMNAGKAAPLDTIHLPLADHRKCKVLDSHGRLWADRYEELDSRVDVVSGRTEVVKTFVEGAAGGRSPINGLTPILEDRAGNIWHQSGGYGLFWSNTRNERFKRVGAGDLIGLNAGNVDGTVLISNVGRGPVVRYLSSERSGKAIPRISPHRDYLMFGAVDDQGRLWAAEVVPGSRAIRVVLFENDRRIDVPSLANDRSRAILPGRNNTLWVVSCDTVDVLTSLVHVDARTGDIIRRYTPPPVFGSGANEQIKSITHHPDGTIWMGTERGLHHLDPKTGVWKVYRHDDRDPGSLPSDLVLTTCLDPAEPEHVLWVGTNGGGLARFDLRTRKFKRYTTKDGLPNNVIYGILSDARKNLWIGTNQGLCQFDPHSGAMTTYTTEDGLPSNEFNTYSYAKADNGELWFEGMGGAFHFNPEDFYEAIPASPTVITSLKLVGKAVTVAGLGNATGEGFELPAPIEYVRSITLPYSERMITFTFACMDHTAPLKNTFRYRLENFSTDWVEVGNVHEATFTNLDPGTYTFRVQGRNSAGVWDERGATMQLIITPPWWGTWWFRIIAALSITAGVVAFYRYRLAQAVKVVRVRERIARDLHDEIGSTLSSVQLYSAVAESKTKGTQPETHELLGRITEGTTSVLEAMNDIVGAVNAENDDLAHVVQRMNSYAERLADARECALRFEVQEGIAAQHLGMTQRKNLYLIFKEALNNAMKYSACKNLLIELRKEGSGHLLRVRDDGIGFEVDAERPDNLGGNGLGNMRRRADEMGGTLHVRSAPGQGTTVELRFSAVPGEISVDHMSSPVDTPR